jgi:Icc-related predicted phosphoesterase
VASRTGERRVGALILRILLVADLHYSLPQFDWVLETAAKYDVVVIAGDLLDIGSSVDPGTQIVVVLKYLQRLRQQTRVLVCSGNHDLDETDADGEKVARWLGQARAIAIPADGDTVQIEGLMVTACAWWDGPHAQHRIGQQLAAAAAMREGTWVWLYHAPPPDSPVSWAGQRYFGDPALAGWIAQHQPDFVLSGHVHEAPFARGGSWVDQIGRTFVFNAGRQIGEVPTTISIDTEAGEAAWFSFEGAEAISLREPLVRPIPLLLARPDWVPA